MIKKKKLGRKKMPVNKRKIHLGVTVKPETKKIISELAEKEGITSSAAFDKIVSVVTENNLLKME